MSMATVIDVYSRKVVGWPLADHMRTSLVADTLRAAIDYPSPRVGQTVFHADLGTNTPVPISVTCV